MQQIAGEELQPGITPREKFFDPPKHRHFSRMSASSSHEAPRNTESIISI